MEDNNVVQYVISTLLGLGGAGVGVGLFWRYVQLQLEEASASLEDRKVMRDAMNGLLEVIGQLSSGIDDRNTIQRTGDAQHMLALKEMVALIRNSTNGAKIERQNIKSDTEKILNKLETVDLNIKHIIDQLRGIINQDN